MHTNNPDTSLFVIILNIHSIYLPEIFGLVSSRIKLRQVINTMAKYMLQDRHYFI